MSIQAYTMTDYHNQITNENITMKSMQYQEMIGESDRKIIINDKSIFRLYRAEMREHTQFVTFTNAEKAKYYYKPWLFCDDKYGLSDLWFELLDLNQIRSFSEFNLETIRVFDSSIISRIKSVLNLEKDIIDINQNDLNEKIKEAKRN